MNEQCNMIKITYMLVESHDESYPVHLVYLLFDLSSEMMNLARNEIIFLASDVINLVGVIAPTSCSLRSAIVHNVWKAN